MEYSYRFVGYGYRPRRTVTSLVATKMPVACACCSLAVMLAALGLGLLLPGCRIAPIQPVEESATSSGVPEPAPPASQPGTPNPPAAGLPALSVADVRAGEADGMLRFTVSLSVAAAEPVTVSYATADGTATASEDYQSTSGTLTFPAGSNQTRQVEVPIIDDRIDEGAETFTLQLSDPHGATLAVGAATATIADARSITGEPNDDDESESAALELASLQVTGGASAVYPAFAAATHHYALTCHDSTTLRVTAQATSSAVSLTLLRDDPNDNHTSAGSLDVQVNVNPDHDIAIELRDSGRTTTYVVHCLPPDFPEIVVLTKAEDVSEGLLFMAPQYTIAGGAWLSYLAIVDNNGVPRFHLTGHKGSWDFRPVRHPITVNGQEVRYLHGRTLFSKDLQVIEAEIPWSMHNNIHDFLITEAGTFVGINQEPVNRDFSDFNDSHGNPYSENEPVHDSVIREFTMAGSVELVWRSWTHRNTLKLSDCQQGNFPSRYAFINSIQFFDDGIVASSRGCNQVIRFERSGAVLSKTTWKLGGSDPGAESDAEYLEIVNDPAGEFCGQHTATLTERDTVMLFDNGVGCSGPRKGKERFTRVIEYDISSGTEARLINEYIPPPEYGVSNSKGSVQDLGGRWLISWGVRSRSRVAANETIAVSEIDPEDGRALLHLHMSQDGKTASTYRVHRSPEVDLPLNLP